MPARSKKSPTKSRAKALSDREAVDEYLRRLVHPLKEEIEALRRIVLDADNRIGEGIKWNAPSFHCGGWFATFDLRSKEWVQIIFHRGAKAKSPTSSRYVNDPSRILQWITNDRGMAKFANEKEVKSKRTALAKIVADWVGRLREEISKP